MSAPSVNRPQLRHRLAEELTTLAALTLYLYICFGALILLKASILREEGISYTLWGVSVIKAVVVAKFMMVGRVMGLGRRYHHLPLIWPTLYRAFVFLVLLLALTTVEEIIVGVIRSRSLASSLQHVVGPIFFEGLAVCLVMLLILLPYCAFQSLADVMGGEARLARMFFVARDDKVP